MYGVREGKTKAMNYGRGYLFLSVSLRAVFTAEAIKEANKLIFDSKHLLKQTDDNLRPLGKEGVLGAYSLTRDPVL